MLDRLLPLLTAHIVLAASAMLLGLVIALPVGIFAARHPRFGRVALGFASLVQTIPSLALLALFYPLLLALSGVVHVPALGFLPSLLALALYALLPILRNTVIGLNGIDPEVIEAADGIGMTAWQKLGLVEAPLALPVVMGGIRTAAVWTIGAATLSTTVGQPSLGDIIFSGLQTQNWVLVLTGCIAAAALALSVDAVLGLAERGVAARRYRLAWTAIAVLVAAPVVALASQYRPPARTVTIGAKNFSEQFILARLIGRRLAAAGYDVRYKEGLGSAVIFRALRSGEIDVYVDYAGTLWTSEMARTDTPAPATMEPAIAAWTHGVGVTDLGSLGFENAYALAMRGRDARTRGIATIGDLARAAPDLTLGADLEFLDRGEWAALQRSYGLKFRATRAYAPTFMYAALGSGDADVISAFSSDGRIAADGLTVLGDPAHALPGYGALVLLGQKAAGASRITAALSPLIGKIPVATMQRANLMVDGQKLSPDAAAAWLDKQVGARQ